MNNIMNNTKIFILIIISFLSMKCSSAIEESKNMNYSEIAKEKLGTGTAEIMNESKDFVLIEKRESETDNKTFGKIQFIVFDLENNKITYEDTLVNANISWFNNYFLKVTTIPGIIRGDQDSSPITYMIDVKSGKKNDESQK